MRRYETRVTRMFLFGILLGGGIISTIIVILGILSRNYVMHSPIYRPGFPYKDLNKTNETLPNLESPKVFDPQDELKNDLFSHYRFPDKPEDDLINQTNTTEFEINSQNQSITISAPQSTTNRETIPDITPQDMTPTTPISQNSQTFMPLPKTIPHVEQMNLQDRLITACKQGDDKEVASLLEQGAQPALANRDGEQPLGAAVWGMNPAVVNVLLAKNSGIVPMTWEEYEQHNLKYYKEVFIVPKFAPQTMGEWYQLLLKIEPYSFVRAFYLSKSDEEPGNYLKGNFVKLKEIILVRSKVYNAYKAKVDWKRETAINLALQGYDVHRTQIKQGVRHASALKNTQESEQRFGIT